MLDTVPVGPEFRANTFTTGSQTVPSIAADPTGGFVIAWRSESQDGNGQGIYAQRFNSAGVPQGGEFRVNTYTTGDQAAPNVAMDAGGNFVIVWESWPINGTGQLGQDGDGPGVYAQRYDAAGVPQGQEFRVNTYTTAGQENPSVAMDGDGDFIVAWESNYQVNNIDVFAQRYTAEGLPQGGEYQVNTHTTARQWRPAVAMDADGDFVVVWESETDSLGQSNIAGQRYSASGAVQGVEFLANTSSTQPNASASVAMDADGDFVVSWTRGYTATQKGYAQRFDSAGVRQGNEFRVDSNPSALQTNSCVAMGADGEFVLTWTKHVPGSAATSYVQRYDATGAAQGGEFRVSTYTSGTQGLARTAVDASGNFVIAFRHQQADGNSDVFARRFSLVPVVVASDFDYSRAPHKLRFSFTHDVSADLGTEDLVVQNLTTGQTIPSSAFSLAYDTATNTATFAYTGTTSGVTGMLPDGEYRATILASGTALPSDYSTEFLFLQGDADHDGRVNLQDFNILAANFGQSPRDFTQGDFNYDAVVNLDDFNVLASRFGVVVAPATSTASTFEPGRDEDEAERDLLA